MRLEGGLVMRRHYTIIWGKLRMLLLVLVFLTGILTVSGCGSEPVGASDLRDRYATAFMDGFWVGYKYIKAGDIDSETKDLLDLRIEDGTTLIHADRATILIDTEKQTVSLQLYGIVGADPETGSLIEISEFTTEPNKIKVGRAGD